MGVVSTAMESRLQHRWQKGSKTMSQINTGINSNDPKMSMYYNATPSSSGGLGGTGSSEQYESFKSSPGSVWYSPGTTWTTSTSPPTQVFVYEYERAVCCVSCGLPQMYIKTRTKAFNYREFVASHSEGGEFKPYEFLVLDKKREPVFGKISQLFDPALDIRCSDCEQQINKRVGPLVFYDIHEPIAARSAHTVPWPLAPTIENPAPMTPPEYDGSYLGDYDGSYLGDWRAASAAAGTAIAGQVDKDILEQYKSSNDPENDIFYG